MAAKKLRLTASVYDQPQGDERDAPTVRISEGEVFEPRNQAEADRLIEHGAAEDPDAVLERAQEDLDRRQADLDAQREALDAERDQAQALAPEKLKGKRLDEQLQARDLSTEGSADEKRARLAEAVSAETG